MSSSRSRRVAAKVWKAGDVAWVKYEAAYRGTLDKRLDGSTTWDVSFDNGDREQVPERLLLREKPAARPRGDEDITFEEQLERARAMELTPERKRKGGDSVASAAKLARSECGGPRDPKVAKLFFQFLYQRATQRRLMYPREEVVGANGPLPPAALPTKGTDGFDHGAQLISVTKFGNVGRYLDSGDQTTGRFVRAKLKHKGVEPWSTQWLGEALLMCTVEMDGWRGDMLKDWAEQTPEDWFLAPDGHRDMTGLNIPSDPGEFTAFANFVRARRAQNPGAPVFSGSYQTQGPTRVLKYYTQRLAKIDGVVDALGAAKTWEDACRAVMQLGGCGPFVGGQALLTFLYGVCADDVSRFAPSLDVGTMIDYCTYGGGPKRMVERLWRVPGESVRLREHEVVARISWLAKNAEAEFAQLGFAFPYQLWKGTKRRRALTAVDIEHSLCYFSRYLAGYEGLKEAGAATVYRMLSGPVTKKECPRPSIKWVASLTANTAADRCRKWLGGEEVDDESDPDE